MGKNKGKCTLHQINNYVKSTSLASTDSCSTCPYRVQVCMRFDWHHVCTMWLCHISYPVRSISNPWLLFRYHWTLLKAHICTTCKKFNTFWANAFTIGKKKLMLNFPHTFFPIIDCPKTQLKLLLGDCPMESRNQSHVMQTSLISNSHSSPSSPASLCPAPEACAT